LVPYKASARISFSIQLSLVGATVAAFPAIFLAVPAAYALLRYRFGSREADYLSGGQQLA
jgi:ABC-type sulfate transport system permease component